MGYMNALTSAPARGQTHVVKRQFNVQLPPDLISQIKHASIDDGTTLSECVEHLLRTGLQIRQS